MNVKQPYKIAVSGAAAGVGAKKAKDISIQAGKEIAKRNIVLLTGGTTGIPQYVAQGASQMGGFVIGFSPASSKKEHLIKFNLPLEHHNLIFYSGFGYAHRNTLLTTLSDAVIVIGGRIGTLNEFTTSFEENKIIGVLLGSGGIADEIPGLIDLAKRGPGRIIYESDPVKLVDMVVFEIQKDQRNHED